MPAAGDVLSSALERLASGVACSTAVEVPSAAAEPGPLAQPALGEKRSLEGDPARMRTCRSEFVVGALCGQEVYSERAAHVGAQPTDVADEGELECEHAEKCHKECGGSAALGGAVRGDTHMSSAAQGGEAAGLSRAMSDLLSPNLRVEAGRIVAECDARAAESRAGFVRLAANHARLEHYFTSSAARAAVSGVVLGVTAPPARSATHKTKYVFSPNGARGLCRFNAEARRIERIDQLRLVGVGPTALAFTLWHWTRGVGDHTIKQARLPQRCGERKAVESCQFLSAAGAPSSGEMTYFWPALRWNTLPHPCNTPPSWRHSKRQVGPARGSALVLTHCGVSSVFLLWEVRAYPQKAGIL